MSSRDINSIEAALIIPEQEKELNLFRSMYYQINAKPDSISKVFSHQVTVSREDIIDLNKRINQKIKMHYRDDGYIATVTVSLSNRQVVDFNCWDEFVAYEWSETCCVKSIILKWNFNIKMPQYEYPQNHVLVVKLSNGLKPEEMLNLIFSGKMEDFAEEDTDAFPIAARVDFIEPILGEELLNIVSNWIGGLKKNNVATNPFVIFLRKYRKKVAYYFNYMAFIMLLLLCNVLINKLIISFNLEYIRDFSSQQLIFVLNSISLIACVLFTSMKLLDRLANKIYEKLTNYGKGYIFNLTKGDEKKQQEIMEVNTHNGKKIICNFIVSLIFNVGCGILTALLI